MQVFMEINGLDISRCIREGGIVQSEVTRSSRTVSTLAGYLEKSEVIKRRITVQLVELRDEQWYAVCLALKNRPVAVHYLDDTTGETRKSFYVSNPTATAQKVLGGNTFFSGGTFTLEEI